MTTLPTHLGGLQHLAPDVIVLADDIVVRAGRPVSFIHENGLGGAVYVEDAERAVMGNIYRRIPVAKQGDIDTSGWKAVKDAAARAGEATLPQALYEAMRSPHIVVVDPRNIGGGGCGGVALAPLPTDAKARKQIPIYSGFIKYFPLAIAEVAKVSQAGNDQHNPGKPLHWDRSKSGDELDALGRHLMQAGTIDSDGQRHTAKLCWRSLAALQKELEAEQSRAAMALLGEEP